MARFERSKAMTLTDTAAARVKEIMASSAEPIAGLRIGVKKGGCAGMEYTMEYAEAQRPHEEVVEDNGVKVFIEPKAILFLLGTAWITGPKSCLPASFSTIRTRRALAAAASRSRSHLRKSRLKPLRPVRKSSTTFSAPALLRTQKGRREAGLHCYTTQSAQIRAKPLFAAVSRV